MLAIRPALMAADWHALHIFIYPEREREEGANSDTGFSDLQREQVFISRVSIGFYYLFELFSGSDEQSVRAVESMADWGTLAEFPQAAKVRIVKINSLRMML